MKTAACKIAFRVALRDKAREWCSKLSAIIRSDWKLLKKNFQVEYTAIVLPHLDPNKFSTLMYKIKQTTLTISEYVTEADAIYYKLPADLQSYMGNRFIAGLADETKII